MRLAEQSTPFVSRLLVVADGTGMSKLLQERYPAVQVSTVHSYMSGIAELANGSVHAILAYVDPTFGSLERAVRGLRQAAGDAVPVVLFCDPEAEPITRKVLAAGATDYLIYPPDPKELDNLLSLQPTSEQVLVPAPQTNEEEMKALSVVLESMASRPQRMLQNLVELIAIAVSARSAEVKADGVTARFGDKMSTPVLHEPIVRNSEPIGELTVGLPAAGGYSNADIEKLRYYAGLCGHILHAAKRQHEWQQLALTDDLTGLPNRRYLMGLLDRLVEQAARERFRVTICMLDIDDFKRYNDQFGHTAGDEILRATGQLLLRHCRTDDVVARYGGDEFVVVFWDSESPRVAGSQHPDEAVEVMNRFAEALNNYNIGCLGPKGKGLLTISCGLVSYPWEAANAQDLLQRADQALRQAKALGKGRIHLIGTNMGPGS